MNDHFKQPIDSLTLKVKKNLGFRKRKLPNLLAKILFEITTLKVRIEKLEKKNCACKS